MQCGVVCGADYGAKLVLPPGVVADGPRVRRRTGAHVDELAAARARRRLAPGTPVPVQDQAGTGRTGANSAEPVMSACRDRALAKIT